MGIDDTLETIVAAYASVSVIEPASFDTIISPEGSPFSSGNRMTNDLPSSSIVVVKSVPRTAIVAVGVDMSMFDLFTIPNLPEANLAVPNAIFMTILDLLGSGS